MSELLIVTSKEEPLSRIESHKGGEIERLEAERGSGC